MTETITVDCDDIIGFEGGEGFLYLEHLTDTGLFRYAMELVQLWDIDPFENKNLIVVKTWVKVKRHPGQEIPFTYTFCHRNAQGAVPTTAIIEPGAFDIVDQLESA